MGVRSRGLGLGRRRLLLSFSLSLAVYSKLMTTPLMPAGPQR